jgi:hypothetical protein
VISDDELVAQLESGALDPEQFHHADHVHAAWIYLTRYTTLEAIARFSNALRAYAAAQGKPGRYHETITWVYLALVNERIHRDPGQATWKQFAAANPDLLDWENSILQTYYSKQTLESALARKIFLMPDRRAFDPLAP